ncbi:diguanylate cyclase domain-containing protein [Vibrio porteresiae]|uniref:Diguanylate cyclase n=1 Tax=Vibrio porteresiae DSM 19223 TaxID=1123496 RepID=A0ABZ0QJG5_9VIBR|nr:diguanylate cyclase [Vibrio porteresiae]WPC76352.1 diguanylate cyclase [Vibrio porteresiae DSM 19223]
MANVKINNDFGTVNGYMVKHSQYSAMFDKALTQLKRTTVDRIPELNALIKLISETFDCPMTVLSLNDDDQENSPQLFISSVGLCETSIDSPDSFCRYIYTNKSMVIVEDAQSDPRSCNSPFIIEKKTQFCAGCPISLDGEMIIGALSIFDDRRRSFGEADQFRLKAFAQVVEGLLRSNLNWLQAKLAFEQVESARVLLERKSALFDELATASGVGGWEFDIESNELVWTQQTREIVGVGPDFVPTMESGFSYFAPEAREIIEDTVNKALVTDGIWASELPFINAQGKHMWVKTTGQGMYKDGKLYRLIGSFQDVSERKLIEQKMSENERLMQAKNNELSAIVNHIPQGVAVYDSRGLLKYWNSQYIDVYKKNTSQVQVRNSFREFLRTRFEREETIEQPDDVLEQMYNAFDLGQPLRKIYHLKTGQIVEALYNQLPDKGWICTSEDITAQEKSREKIQHAAHHDTLTGLANRTQFNQYVEKLTKHTQEANQHHMLMLIDLDYFKDVNDHYGHSAGDAVLKDVAVRLKSSVRETDLVCRFGGDEFAILLTGNHNITHVAQEMAERIVNSICEPFDIGGKEIHIGVSIGVSWIDEEDKELNEALKRADLALYQTKTHGRNGFKFYQEDMTEDNSFKDDK